MSSSVLHNGGVFMVAPLRVSCDRLKWYQVVLSVSQVEVRSRVQAATIDAAAHLVMRSHGFAFADSASIWLLGRSGAPVRRSGLRCRLPLAPSSSVVRVGR